VTDGPREEYENTHANKVVRGILIGSAAVGAILLVIGLWAFVRPSDPTEKKDFVQAVGILLAGLVGLIGLFFTWRNQRLTQRSLEVTQKTTQYQLRLAEHGQITERFTRAIDQLGATDDKGRKKLEIRLGGIYALERITRDSERDYWPIMEILTAYVREHAPWPPEKRAQNSTSDSLHPSQGQHEQSDEIPSRHPDIQTILYVLQRRIHHFGSGESERLQLFRTNLRGAYLYEAHLEGADLIGTHLEGAILQEAHLEGAILQKAHLEGANLSFARLKGANLSNAHLEGALLAAAHLEGANLTQARMEVVNFDSAHLEGANLSRVHLQGATLAHANLEEADLYGADLNGAHLRRTHLKGASLVRANLEEADLLGANLQGADLSASRYSQEQIRWAIGDETTKLPSSRQPPRTWVYSIEQQSQIIDDRVLEDVQDRLLGDE
jgi:uncharacterized protein YjbI with pentapeptide repeats